MMIKQKAAIAAAAFLGLAGVAVTLAVGLTNGWLSSANGAAPHIVLVFVDDLGFNDVSWHNNKVIMPNLADLAAGGVTLEQAYAQELCTPSRAALLTGYYPIRIGMQEGVVTSAQTNGLPLELTLLPEHLKNAGYTSYMVGKWHLGFCSEAYTPLQRGFSSHYGFYNGAIAYYTHLTDEGGHEALDYRDETAVNNASYGEYTTTDFTNAAIDKIETHDPNNPMFLYMAYNAPHIPFEVDSSYTDLYSPILKGGNRKTYLGMISALDDQIARLVDALKDNGFWDNTVFVFYSDNGGGARRSGQGGNNYPLRGRKSTMWEGGYRVPAFVSSKLLSNSGYVHNGLVHVTDLFATFIYLANNKDTCEIPANIDGMNIWEALSDKTASPRTELVYNIITKAHSSKKRSTVVPQAAIRSGKYKLIEGDPGGFGGLDDWIMPPENDTDIIGTPTNYGPFTVDTTDYYVFDLDADPYETNNLASTLSTTTFDSLKGVLTSAKQDIVDAIASDTTEAGDPANFGGVWSPGFC